MLRGGFVHVFALGCLPSTFCAADVREVAQPRRPPTYVVSRHSRKSSAAWMNRMRYSKRGAACPVGTASNATPAIVRAPITPLLQRSVDERVEPSNTNSVSRIRCRACRKYCLIVRCS
jgi:hypothetical protein